MYSFTVRGKTVSELKVNIQAILANLDGSKAPLVSHEDVQEMKPAKKKKAEAAPIAAAEKVAEPEKQVPEETKSAPEPKAAAAPKAKPTTVIEPASEEITVEKLRGVLNKVSSKKGMAESIKLLKKYGASRISDLAPEKYADFLDDCTAAVA